MRYIFRFPDIGEGITEGKILEWYVKKGQQVKSGDSLVKMETDKVVTDIPSPKAGVISAVYGAVGEMINVEDPLVEIDIEGVAGEEAQQVNQEKAEKPKDEQVEEKGFGVVGTLEVAGDNAILSSSEEGVEQSDEPVKLSKKALATPVARAMAKDLGVDINTVTGSGPGGRVMKQDIRKAYDSRYNDKPVKAIQLPGNDLVEIEPLSQIRKTIAKNMIHSKQNAAHMTAFEEVEVSSLMDIRSRFKEEFKEQGVKLTYLAFIIKAVAESLKRHKSLNAEMDLDNDRMIYKKHYNIGIAVDTDAGLVVPVIKNVDKLSILEIAKEIMIIAEKARERKLTLDDMKGGTFSVTNYGAIGGLFAVPVINYPQAAILGIGRLHQKPVVKDGEIVIGNVFPLSLSVDHRIVDGGEATRFLNDIIRYLNDPISLMMLQGGK